MNKIKIMRDDESRHYHLTTLNKAENITFYRKIIIYFVCAFGFGIALSLADLLFPK